MRGTTESSNSLLIFRTALLALLSQGAEHCSLDTHSTSGCDPCLRNPSSLNRPFPQHATQRPIHTHSCLRLNSLRWGGSRQPKGNKGIKAPSHFFEVYCVCSGKQGICSFFFQMRELGWYSTASWWLGEGWGYGGGLLILGWGEKFRSTKQTQLFPFSRVAPHILAPAVEEVKLVWISNHSDIWVVYPACSSTC